jgi:Sec-independent protein secretion pathway component TatC
MGIALAIVALLVLGAIVGSLINFGSLFLGIPLVLLFIGAVIGKEGMNRQRRILQMKRFRNSARAQKVDFTPEDKRTMV